jgi:hypothetical protein
LQPAARAFSLSPLKAYDVTAIIGIDPIDGLLPELKPAMGRIAFLGNAARIYARARNLLKMARDPDPIDKHVGKRIRLRRLAQLEWRHSG